MIGRYEAIPFVPDVKADLTGYVVGKALDGIFFYIAKEDAAIRNNPAARTTKLLKKGLRRRVSADPAYLCRPISA